MHKVWTACSVREATCSAPISFSGRLLTNELVNFTRMILFSCASVAFLFIGLESKIIPWSLVEQIAKIFLLFNKGLNQLDYLFCTLHEFAGIWGWSADLIDCRPRRPAQCDEGWIDIDFELPKNDINRCRDRAFKKIDERVRKSDEKKEEKLPDKQVAFNLKCNLFFELGINLFLDLGFKLMSTSAILAPGSWSKDPNTSRAVVWQ